MLAVLALISQTLVKHHRWSNNQAQKEDDRRAEKGVSACQPAAKIGLRRPCGRKKADHWDQLPNDGFFHKMGLPRGWHQSEFGEDGNKDGESQIGAQQPGWHRPSQDRVGKAKTDRDHKV